MKCGEMASPDRARAWTAYGLFVALLAGAVLAQGCGQGNSETKQAQAQVETVPAGSAPGTVASMAVAEAAKAPEKESESLPPDVEVSVQDTLVTPGQTVEFLVHATADVNRLALSDGSGETLPFLRDGDPNQWRVTYRVPLRPRHERWGVSVTARTEANRWCRVWVFLHTKPATESVAQVKPDTTSVPVQ